MADTESVTHDFEASVFLERPTLAHGIAVGDGLVFLTEPGLEPPGAQARASSPSMP